MQNTVGRRRFVKSMLAAPALVLTSNAVAAAASLNHLPQAVKAGSKLKLSLNAYSFNDPLRKGEMTLSDLLDFCAEHGFDAVDLTGYYFAGYPQVPTDAYIFELKKKAFRLGLDISGTGVRNDFAVADAGKRKADVQLVKNWIEVAAKLGAPVIRVFAGLQIPEGYSWQQAATWMIDDMRECAAYGKQHGVLVAMQNHNDFIKTAKEASYIVEKVNSDWFGLVLDIGSYRGADPYTEISETAKYAFNWQLKETMFFNGVEQKTDVAKIIAIISASGYRGYVPIETLGAGDPKIKVPVFLAEVKKALENA